MVWTYRCSFLSIDILTDKLLGQIRRTKLRRGWPSPKSSIDNRWPQLIGHGEKLSRKREQALYSLVHQPTIVAAARDIGIGEATLRRWLKNPVFRSEYRRYKQEIFEHSIALLQVSGDEAVKTLLLSLRAGSEHVRLRAACAILDYAIKGSEIIDLEGRVSQLEEAKYGY